MPAGADLVGNACPDGAPAEVGPTGGQAEVPVCGQWLFPGKLQKMSRAPKRRIRARVVLNLLDDKRAYIRHAPRSLVPFLVFCFARDGKCSWTRYLTILPGPAVSTAWLRSRVRMPACRSIT